MFSIFILNITNKTKQKTKQSPATDFPSLCAYTDEYILMC